MSFDWIWRITTKQQSNFPSLQIVYQNILWVIQVRFLQFNQNCFSTNTDYATYQIHVIISHIKWHSIKLSTKRQEENLEILHYFYKNRKHTMKLAAEGWCTKTWLGLGGCCWGWKYTPMGCLGCTVEGWTCDWTGLPAEETSWLTICGESESLFKIAWKKIGKAINFYKRNSDANYHSLIWKIDICNQI